MSANGGMGDDAQQEAQAVARGIRETVADQLHDLVLEREGVGTLAELTNRVRRVGQVWNEINQAIARQHQAESLGLPIADARREEREARELLRQTVMSLGEACGSWVVALDYERARPRVESGL